MDFAWHDAFASKLTPAIPVFHLSLVHSELQWDDGGCARGGRVIAATRQHAMERAGRVTANDQKSSSLSKRRASRCS